MRTRHLKIRLTENELETIENRAGAMTKSSFVRLCALDRVPITIPASNQKAVVELNKIGSNLNQLVRLAHLHSLDSDIERLKSTMSAAHSETCRLAGVLAPTEK